MCRSLPDSVKTQLAKDAQYQALLGGMQSVVDGIGAAGTSRTCSTGCTGDGFGG